VYWLSVWVHGKCGGAEGGMCTVMETFICRGFMVPVTGVGCTGVDVGVSVNLELVDVFCWLGDMLGVDGDAGAAVESGV